MTLQTILYFASILLACAFIGFLAWYAWRGLALPGIHTFGARAALRDGLLKRPPSQQTVPLITNFDDQKKRSLSILVLIFILFTSSLTAIGYLTYRNYEKQFRAQVDSQLESIASLKADELQNWRAERLADANLFYRNKIFSEQAQNYLETPGDADAQTRLLTRMKKTATSPEYDRVFLLDPRGVERLSLPADPEAVPAELVEQASASLASDQVVFLDFHRHSESEAVYLSMIVPIYDPQDNQPLGTVVLRIDPNVHLYPFIQRWPVPSESAETLLLRRDGEQAVYLNELRFQPDAALDLRFPLTETQIPAVRAALGETGIVEGLDYRGVEVIADIRAVPNSPWFLVSKMDTAEVYAPLRARLWQTIVFFGALILASGAGLGLTWRQQRVRYYRAQAGITDALRASEEKFRLTFETSPDSVAITRARDSMFVSVNKGFEQITGYKREEVIGKTSLEVNIWKNPEDRRKIVEGLQTRGEVRDYEAPFLTRDGEIIGMMSAVIIQLDGEPHILNITRDITARKQAENMITARLRLVEFAAHHSMEELLTKTLDEVCAFTNSPIGFYHFLEPDQKTLSLQAWSTRTMQEYCKAEGKGLHYDVAEAGVWAECIHQRKPVIHNDYASLPATLKKGLPAGHAALIRELVVPIFREDWIVAILGIGNKTQDYTEKDIDIAAYFGDVAWEIAKRKRTEQQLADYTEHLEEMVDERTAQLKAAQEHLVRQERLATLGQLAGSIGHELRNPLGVIANAVYFLKLSQPGAGDKVREYLDIIENETRASDKIVADLLDFTRVKSLDRRPAPVSQAVQATLERHPAPPSVQVTLDIPDDLPPAYADPRHVEQVLGNLVVNACQAMTNGGKLTIAAGTEDDMIFISVKDTGEGIPPENLGKIFEPLFTTRSRGIGLGLAVSQKLAEANGGRLAVQSASSPQGEAGAGSIFTLYLPVYKEST